MNIKEEKIKLILQFLRQNKYDQTFHKLQEQSFIQLDPYNLELITQSILNYDIQLLEQILNQHLDESTKQICMLKVLEQYYIKLLKSHNIQEAIQLLRNQITKFCTNEQQKHQYASMLYLKELKLKPQQELIDEIISLCYKQIGLIEPNRLVTIIQQSQANQILQCQFHNQLEQNYTITSKHQCNPQLNIIQHKKNITHCTFSLNGQYKALVHGLQIYLYIFENSTNGFKQKPRKIQTGHSSIITSILFSPCNKYVGTSSEDFTVFVYNIETQKKYKLEGHHSKVQCFSFVLSDQSKKKWKNEYDIYTISVDGWLYEWNESERKGGLKIEEKLLKLYTHQQKELMLITSQNKISLYQLYSKQQISSTFSIQNIQNSIVNKQFDYALIFINEITSQLFLYSIPGLLIIKVFDSPSSISILNLQFDFGWFNSNLIAAGTNKGELIVWHIQKQSQPIQKYQISDQEKEITCIKFHPTKNQLYVYQQKDPKQQQQQQQQYQQSNDEIRSQELRNLLQRPAAGIQQILSFLQRIARQDQMSSSRQSMQEEDKESSDEDM